MNGAHALLGTLRINDVNVVFANPGTSEMHFVAALDDVTDVRGVLCLFEGVATGAADGYARVTGRPAATLLHLGPGLANGWANLHNARRARVPLLNVVGDHATYHAQYDAPLQSDMAAVAGALNGTFARPTHPDDVPAAAAGAIAAAFGPPARVSTLALPADVSWGELTQPVATWPRANITHPYAVNADLADYAAQRLRTTRTALFLGGTATGAAQLALAQRVGALANARVIIETFPVAMDRGRGVVHPERLIYLSEFAASQLEDLETLILVGASEPVSFFAYPNLPSRLVASGCEIVELAPPGVDTGDALRALVECLGSPPSVLADRGVPIAPTGELTAASFADAVAATLPEGAIIADESNTSGLHLYAATALAAPHRLLTLTGGAIGFGLPVAVGAAVGSKSRVLALESDGSLLYTVQALWTMAREALDVTVVILANRRYAILDFERRRVGTSPAGASSQRLIDLDDPDIDFVSVARGFGVPAVRATTADELVGALRHSYRTAGPFVIEVPLPSVI